MTRLTERKRKLTLITNASAWSLGKQRSVVVEVSADIATLRLLGTRTRYEVSWRGVFDYAARVTVDRRRGERKAVRA